MTPFLRGLYIFSFFISVCRRGKNSVYPVTLALNFCMNLQISVLFIDPFPAPELVSLWFLIFILKLFHDHTHNLLTLTKILLSLEGTYIPSCCLKFWPFLFLPSTTTTQLSLEIRQVISFTPFPCLILSSLLKLFLPSTLLSSFLKSTIILHV